MKITAIKKQIANNSRYSVFVDNKYSFSLSERLLLNKGLRTGTEITNQEILGLKKAALKDDIYERVLNLIARRPKTKWEIRQYLYKNGATESESLRIIKKLQDLDLINDERFANNFVDYYSRHQTSSSLKIKSLLLKKHIEPDLIEAALQEIETNDSLAIKIIIENKRKQSKYQDKQKLLGYISRQGFSYEDIKNALSELGID